MDSELFEKITSSLRGHYLNREQTIELIKLLQICYRPEDDELAHHDPIFRVPYNN